MNCQSLCNLRVKNDAAGFPALLSLGYLLAGECVGRQHLDTLWDSRTLGRTDRQTDRRSCDVQHGLRSFAVACGARVKGLGEKEAWTRARISTWRSWDPSFITRTARDGVPYPFSARFLAFVMWRSRLHSEIRKRIHTHSIVCIAYSIQLPKDTALLGDKTSCAMMDATSWAHKFSLFLSRETEDRKICGGVYWLALSTHPVWMAIGKCLCDLCSIEMLTKEFDMVEKW